MRAYMNFHNLENDVLNSEKYSYNIKSKFESYYNGKDTYKN